MYEKIRPLLFKLDPECAHKFAEKSLRLMDKIWPSSLNLLSKNFNNEILEQELFGLNFKNPIGLAGGFDKNASMIRPLAALGFGFLELGTLTLRPQSGNLPPRLFRLEKEESLQNAMGFNNDGSEKIAKRLQKMYPFILPLGVNIGKNKDTPNENALNDYFALFEKFDAFCDYFIVNISSPNTQNLRDLQNEDFLTNLFTVAKKITQKNIFIKIAPDMSVDLALKLCECAINSGALGFVIANTSTDYSLTKNARNFGGISGKLIQEKSGIFFKELAKILFGKAILISSGGIDSAQIAYERIKNGANLIEIFTALIYKGPRLVYELNKGLVELLQRDGFTNISDAVGANLK